MAAGDTHKEEPTWEEKEGTVIATGLESISASTESLSAKVLPPSSDFSGKLIYGWLLS